MLLSFVIAAAAGMLIGQSIRVWLLFAVIVVAMIATLAVGLYSQTGVGSTIGYVLTISVALQVGYWLGLVIGLTQRPKQTGVAIHTRTRTAGFYSGRGPDQNDSARL